MSFPAALPHSPITKVLDGVHVVRGGFRMGPGVVIGRTMTIVETSNGLAILNAMRLTEAGQAELDRLGKVRHLVHLSDSHGADEPYYVDRYAPEVWAPSTAKSAAIKPTRTLDTSPIEGAATFDYPGTSGWTECGLWLPRGGGTLVTTDALQNHADQQHSSLLGRIMTPLMGFKGGVIVAPMWRKYQRVSGAQVSHALSRALEQRFANLITGHGPAVIGGAEELARAAVASAAAD